MDKIREEFEAKYLIPEGIFYVNAEGFEEYAISDQCSMTQYESLCYQCSYLNDSYRAFRRGYQAAKASQWISVEEDEPKLGEEVAVTWDGCEELSTDYLEIDSDTGTHYWANYHAEPPTHWKRLFPLPEGPTE